MMWRRNGFYNELQATLEALNEVSNALHHLYLHMQRSPATDYALLQRVLGEHYRRIYNPDNWRDLAAMLRKRSHDLMVRYRAMRINANYAYTDPRRNVAPRRVIVKFTMDRYGHDAVILRYDGDVYTGTCSRCRAEVYVRRACDFPHVPEVRLCPSCVLETLVEQGVDMIDGSAIGRLMYEGRS